MEYDELTIDWDLVDRVIDLMARTKHDLVRFYAEPGGGKTEPIGEVATWSKAEIVKAIVGLDEPLDRD